jgi:hypothetical protein
MQADTSIGKSQASSGNRKIQEELKELREAFVNNFNEQMKLRWVPSGVARWSVFKPKIPNFG